MDDVAEAKPEIAEKISLKKEMSSQKKRKKCFVKSKANYAMKAEKIDILFLIGFPFAFFVFNLVYWIAYLRG